jgi:hypothetical protein
MLSFIIQISFISIIFIFLVHHLILFFKTTLTVPKIKDLVNSSNQKYQNIYDTLYNQNLDNQKLDNQKVEKYQYTDIDLLPNNDYVETENSSMKNELKSFLKKQLNTNTNTNTNTNINNDVMSLDTLSNGNFSEF